jgi:uncharacterized membrane protein (UPF0182 family)
MFKVQRELLSLYHVTDPAQFYNASDAWQVPDDPTKSTDNNAVPPYYLSMKLPGDTAQQFSLTTTFTPSGRPNLRAFMAVDADANSSGYGKIRLMRVTDDKVDGPEQVQSRLNRHGPIATYVRDLKGADSTIKYGNLLTVPLDSGFLYVEPIYAQGRGSEYPLLSKVAVVYGSKIGFADDLSGALSQAFGAEGAPDEETPPTEPSEPPSEPDEPPVTGDGALEDAIADAQKAYDDARAALEKNPTDWAAYGKAQADLEAALQRAADAEKAQPRSAPGSEASPDAKPDAQPDQGSSGD